MDLEEARARLLTERADVMALLKEAESATEQDIEAETAPGPRDEVDAAQPLAAEDTDTYVEATLRDRLEQIDRALQRAGDGTYGRSVRSGKPIPEERLEADPAAELTVEEAAAEARA